MPDVMELFQKYHDDVYRLALSYTHSIQEAEDISQTVFLKLMNQKDLSPGKEKAWLMQVTVNQCKSLFRQSFWKKREAFDETVAEPVCWNNDNEIWEAIIRLKPKYRVVIYLFYYEDYSTKEIAKLLKISCSAVTTRLSRARKLLSEEIKEVLS